MTAVLYDLLFAIPVSFIAVIMGKPYFVSPEKNLPLYVVTLMTLAVCTTVRHWENRLKYGIPGAVVVLGAGITLIQGPEKRGEFLYVNQWILWTVLTAMGCYVAGCLISRIRALRCLTAGGLLIGLLVITFWGYWPDKMVVAASIMVIASVVADELQRTWEKSGYVDKKGHLVSVSPFLLGFCILIFLIPAPEKPYDWGFAVRLWDRATDMVKLTIRWVSSGKEEYGEIGFLDETKLWGNLKKKDKEVLVLTSGKDAGSVIYLKGKVMDTFDGITWTAQYEGGYRDDMIDALETVGAVWQYDADHVRNYLLRVDVKATYKEFNTKHFFLPEKTILNSDKLGGEAYTLQGGNVIAEKNLGYGTEYTVTFFRLNDRHEGFERFLEEAKAPTREGWDGVRYQYESRKGDASLKQGTTYEDYQEYRERMRRQYLPETHVSEKTMAVLNKLFEGADSDLEKLRRLEMFLGSLRYELSPGKLPDEVDSPEDFLDHFLLKSQEGYCSHFATAFVLIARNQGIPARYVQGFYVPRGSERSVTVKSSMAHAWPEAYLDGIGWIPFEPTPNKLIRETWEFQKNEEIGLSGSEGNDWHVSEELTDPELLIASDDEEEEEKGISIRWQVVLMPFGLVLLFLFAFLMVDRLLVLAWYRKLSEFQRFHLACKKNWRVLGYLGFVADPGETLEEFAARVGEEVPLECLTFLGAQELVAYAGVKPSKEMRADAEKNLAELMKILKESKGKWYFWYRYQIFRMEAGKKLDKA